MLNGKVEELHRARVCLESIAVIMYVLFVRGFEIFKGGKGLSEGEDLIDLHLVCTDSARVVRRLCCSRAEESGDSMMIRAAHHG